MTMHLTTGFPSLDACLGGGLRREDLIVLGGESGVGCSALAVGIALRAARNGASVAVLSTEMSPTRLAERALGQAARATLDELAGTALDDQRRADIAAVALQLRSLPLAFHTQPAEGWTPDLAGVAEGAELLVVDALEGLHWGRHRRAEAAAAWVLACKRAAIARGVPVILARHAGTVEGVPRGTRPTLDLLGDLGVREQADVVLGLHREDLMRPDPAVAGSAEVLVLKDRFGGLGSVDLWFEPTLARFEDLAEA
jgi:replicative DNA helicase